MAHNALIRQFTQLDRRLQLRPDAMLSTTTNKNETLRCLVAEVKAPNRSSNGDFLKLAFEMKCALDTMIDHHVDNPYSLGIQVEGRYESLALLESNLCHGRLYSAYLSHGPTLRSHLSNDTLENVLSSSFSS